MPYDLAPTNRRDFLRILGAAGLSWSLWGGMGCSSAPAVDLRKFQGIFPIVQTPYTDDNKIAFDELEKEVKFLDKTGVHGIVWPQRASEYQFLTFDERIEGAELIVKANKGLNPAVVIGVQGPDTETAVKYARHAEKLQPDAIIALPTRDAGEFDLDEVFEYYKAIGKVCGLPMFVQTTGNMSVEFVLKMAREVPTLLFVKDEAGNSISRIKEFNADGEGRVTVFTGGHGRNLPDEMSLGLAGNMPASGWVDLYVKVWNFWKEGEVNEALDMFSKAMLFVTQAGVYGFPLLNYALPPARHLHELVHSPPRSQAAGRRRDERNPAGARLRQAALRRLITAGCSCRRSPGRELLRDGVHGATSSRQRRFDFLVPVDGRHVPTPVRQEIDTVVEHSFEPGAQAPGGRARQAARIRDGSLVREYDLEYRPHSTNRRRHSRLDGGGADALHQLLPAALGRLESSAVIAGKFLQRRFRRGQDRRGCR